MEWGPHITLLEKQVEDTGKNPKSLQKRPVLFEDLIPVWNAFQSLSRHRPIFDMGLPGLIPLSELKVYMDMNGIEDGDHRAEFVELIGAMDDVYIEHGLKKRKKG